MWPATLCSASALPTQLSGLNPFKVGFIRYLCSSHSFSAYRSRTLVTRTPARLDTGPLAIGYYPGRIRTSSENTTSPTTSHKIHYVNFLNGSLCAGLPALDQDASRDTGCGACPGHRAEPRRRAAYGPLPTSAPQRAAAGSRSGPTSAPRCSHLECWSTRERDRHARGDAGVLRGSHAGHGATWQRTCGI